MSFPSEYFFVHLQKAAVLAADANRLNAQLLHHGHQIFIDPAQDHLRDLHGFLIRHPQTVHEGRLLAHLFHPSADGLSAAVYDDGLKADQL